jgi:hypothetical protein
MTSAVKKNGSHGKAPLTTPEMRGELAKLIAESRRLNQRMELLAERFGDSVSSEENAAHIPERGRVRIIESIADAEELAGKEGVALAGGPDAAGNWTYTVLIDTINETYLLPESALQFLGWTVLEPMYGEPAFAVRVDQRAKGTVVRKPRKRGK